MVACVLLRHGGRVDPQLRCRLYVDIWANKRMQDVLLVGCNGRAEAAGHEELGHRDMSAHVLVFVSDELTILFQVDTWFPRDAPQPLLQFVACLVDFRSH